VYFDLSSGWKSHGSLAAFSAKRMMAWITGWKERWPQHPLRDEDKRIPPGCLGSSECYTDRIPACRCVDSGANLFEQAVNLAIFTTGCG
jgi:hypothetical protein